jgi:pimeloyl-ACP methyl ester carboxylesterase
VISLMFATANRTPPFRDDAGDSVAGSVAEAGFRRIGGLDQWVLVRGRDRTNPLLVILHGGPGSSETAPLRACNAELEDHFVVVYWDQRGAGRSYRRGLDPASMTTERFVADLDELVEQMLAKFGKQRVVLLGHSWGSMLGVAYAARRPDRVAAYVGAGQVSDFAKSEAASYAFALAEAEKRRHRRALKDLQAIGPPPYGRQATGRQRRWLLALGGATGPGFSLLGLAWRALKGPDGSLLDLVRLVQGANFSIRHMLDELARADLPRDYPRLAVPVFFILGRFDHQVVAELSAAYFEAIEAPYKQLIWLERAGHFMPFEEPEAFNRILVEQVRPFALAAGRAAVSA